MDIERALQADSLLYANEDLNGLVDKFKVEINNLRLVGKGKEHSNALFSSPFSFGVLIAAILTVDERTGKLINCTPKKEILDSILLNVRSVQTDSLRVKKNIENASADKVVAILSGIQMECSKATNLALNEVRQSIVSANKSH